MSSRNLQQEPATTQEVMKPPPPHTHPLPLGPQFRAPMGVDTAECRIVAQEVHSSGGAVHPADPLLISQLLWVAALFAHPAFGRAGAAGRHRYRAAAVPRGRCLTQARGQRDCNTYRRPGSY